MLVNINHLSSHIGDRTILDDVSMIIEEQDKIAVVGVNGAGKSTFLSLIASRDPAITYKKDMTISYLPQLPQFNEDLTIIQQAKEALIDVQDYEIKASLNRYGLYEHDVLIKTLSGGQRKRLALAIAMLKECDLLILDEPTNHLDTPMIETLEKALIRRNKALLMVTHDRYFLERITHKIVDITRSQLNIYEANYSSYLEQKAIHEEALMMQEHKRNQFLRKEIEWVRAGVQARTTKSKARLQHFEELNSIAQLSQQRDVNLIHTAARSGKKTIELVNVSKTYNNTSLFDDFSYQFKRFDRIGI
ncbi:MAG: ABC-F family ATP-binding cassette domain-containing protein, partial [Erysipelotrichaceae bacterium]|nr:ABC-F family ATP-binding cassette domain-containing protein [Erysipelotrichaceae bacterium]